MAGAGRWIRRAGVAAAAALTAVALVPHGATADTNGGPSVWQAEAVTSGVQVAANEKGFLIAEILNLNIPDGDSKADSSNQDKARASTIYPGLGVSQGPSLLCTAGLPCPPGFPPAWPFTTYAQYPSAPQSSLATGQQYGGPGSPLAVTSDSAQAEAQPSGTHTTATTNDIEVPGGSSVQSASVGFHERAAAILHRPWAGAADAGSSSAVLSVGSALGSTSVAIQDGKLVSTASTVLKHVALLGGTVDIGSIDAVSTSITDGASVTKAESHVTLGSVTVAGQKAAIDDSGVHVVSSPGVGGDQVNQLNQALQQALQAAGWRLQLIGATQKKDADAPQASAKGVLLYSQADLGALPEGSLVYSSFLLGSADSQASAEAAAAAGGTDLGGALTGTGPVGGGGGGSALPAAAGGTGASTGGLQGGDLGGGSTALSGSGQSPVASGPTGSRGSGGRLTASLPNDGLAASRTTMTYLAAALAALLLAVGAPWALPALAGRPRRTRRTT